MEVDFNKIVTRPDPIFLDIGTHNGEDSIKFLQMFPGATVYAFEADPAVWPIFEANVNSKVGYPNSRLKFIKSAVGDIDGQSLFFSSVEIEKKRPGASGTFQKPTAHLYLHPHVGFNEVIIDCLKLDTWFKNQNIDFIDFAWTDVNGAEVALVKGGRNTFLNHTKFLQLECIDYQLWENQSTRSELANLLPGFALLADDGHNLLLLNTNLA